MKYATERPYSDPEKAARRILEIANSVEAIQDGRIHVEKINGPFCFGTAEARPNTALACRSRSSAAGSICTGLALTRDSRLQALSWARQDIGSEREPTAGETWLIAIRPGYPTDTSG